MQGDRVADLVALVQTLNEIEQDAVCELLEHRVRCLLNGRTQDHRVLYEGPTGALPGIEGGNASLITLPVPPGTVVAVVTRDSDTVVEQ